MIRGGHLEEKTEIDQGGVILKTKTDSNHRFEPFFFTGFKPV